MNSVLVLAGAKILDVNPRTMFRWVSSVLPKEDRGDGPMRLSGADMALLLVIRDLRKSGIPKQKITDKLSVQLSRSLAAAEKLRVQIEDGVPPGRVEEEEAVLA